MPTRSGLCLLSRVYTAVAVVFSAGCYGPSPSESTYADVAEAPPRAQSGDPAGSRGGRHTREIVRIELRNHVLVVHGSGVFDLADTDGAILAGGMDEAAFREKFPSVFREFRRMTSSVDAGL